MESIRKIVREVLSEGYEEDSIDTKKYSDADYDWFEEVFPLKMDRNKLSSVSDLYTIHYGDKGKSIIRLSGDRCHINTIAVIDDYKNSGIGSKILQAVISLCESAGVKLITANVSENNIPSINLFVNSGFKQNEDVTDRFYDDKSQKLAYYLELNSDNVLEEGVKEWILAGSLTLASMAPNSLIAQEYDKGDETTKEKIINKIKIAKENGNEKASKLFNNFNEKLKSLKNNDTEVVTTGFSTEKLEKTAKEMDGVLGVGESTNLSSSVEQSLFDAKAKIGKENQKDGKIYKQVTTMKPNSDIYITYTIYTN